MTPLISICIPAYKRVSYLKRLLDSVKIQTYKNFEVVITDDSSTDEVEVLCNEFTGQVELRYIKNQIVLGTPENWNEAIRHAKGTWIKLMHDDDWFENEYSLEKFVQAIDKNRKASFFFTGYYNIFEDNVEKQEVKLNPYKKWYLLKPIKLIAENVIGPPSVTIYKNQNFFFDKNLKWLVDIDFYIQALSKHKPHYINQSLINIGINAEQVTKTSFRVAHVEIPEHFYVLKKFGFSNLRFIEVYDAIWRLIRNLRIKTIDQIRESGYRDEIPESIKTIITVQCKIPLPILKIGVFSKICMFLTYSLYLVIRKST